MNNPVGFFTDLAHQVLSLPHLFFPNETVNSVALHSQAYSNQQKPPLSVQEILIKVEVEPCVPRDQLGLKQPSV